MSRADKTTYCGITDPARASALLDRFIAGIEKNTKGFRSAPSGKHHKGRVVKKTAVERLARTMFGE